MGETIDETTGAGAVHKALSLMLALASDGGETPAARIAEDLGLPASSARRLVAAMVRENILMRLERGHYAAGPALARLGNAASLHARLAAAARAPMRRLAQVSGEAAVHLGVLEGEMVTYLAKQSASQAFAETRTGTQLEAYCTGIGKMLLACLPEGERETFLKAGSFVPITASTITAPADLRAQLQKTRTRGHALDDAEMFEGLRCIAVPVIIGTEPVAAISLSRHAAWDQRRMARDVARLETCAGQIAQVMSRKQPSPSAG